MQGHSEWKKTRRSTLVILVSFHSQFESCVSHLYLNQKLSGFVNKNVQQKSQIKCCEIVTHFPINFHQNFRIVFARKNIFKLGIIANLSVTLGFRVDKAAGDVSVACSQRLGMGLNSDQGQVEMRGDGSCSCLYLPTIMICQQLENNFGINSQELLSVNASLPGTHTK